MSRMHFMAAFAWALGLVLMAPALHAQGSGRPQVALKCVSFGMGPMLECTVDLKGRDGAPLDGARVTLGALMPSMPMAHQVRPVAAASTGRPGQYRGTLELEMPGVWAVEVGIAGPVRDKFVQSLAVDDCDGDRRCPATAPPARSTSQPTSQSKPLRSPP